MKSIITALLSLCIAGTASATLVVGYDSGVTATPGASGAADPAGQGWTFTGDASGFSDGFDSGNGGWRTVDGTGGDPANYSLTLSGGQLTQLTTAAG